MKVLYIHTSMFDSYDPKLGTWVSHVISTDTKGRRWERWDGLGQSNGDSLIRSPNEPTKRKRRNAR